MLRGGVHGWWLGTRAVTILFHVQAITSSTIRVETTAEDLTRAATDLQPWLEAVYSRLHSSPELSFQELKTSQTIVQHLQELQIDWHHVRGSRTGIVATVGKDQPVVVVRADIDGLPIREDPDNDPRSLNDDVMHACGHDAHTAMLLGAGALLKSHERQLQGTVKLLFQPGEEAGQDGILGAQAMIHSGELEGASAIFGLHVDPSTPSGDFAVGPGAVFASEVNFKASFTGTSGHAGFPQQTVDCIPCAAGFVLAAQTLVSRELAPSDQAVISITSLQAGDGKLLSIIPGQAAVAGTIRCLTDEVQATLQRRLEEVLHAQAASCRCHGSLEWLHKSHPRYPVLINDGRLADFVRTVAVQTLGPARVTAMQPVMAAEDFAYYSSVAPVCFSLLGTRNASIGAVKPLHNPGFRIDPEILHMGAQMHASIAWQFLNQFQTQACSVETPAA